jgi:antitoxin ParD1/3/4
MSITLPPRAEALLQKKMVEGGYDTPGQVIEEALQLLEERDWVRQRRLEELRKEIAVGLEQLDRGEYVIFDEDEVRRLNAEGRERLTARTQKQ